MALGRHNRSPKPRTRQKAKEYPLRRQFCWKCASTVHSIPTAPKVEKCPTCGEKMENPQWGQGAWG